MRVFKLQKDEEYEIVQRYLKNTLEQALTKPSQDSGPANPVFVIGVFRSGTSLLYSLLNQHPRVALMYECDVWNFPRLFSKWRFAGNWLERQEFYNQALSRHRLVYGGSLAGLEQVKTPGDIYKLYGTGKGVAFWGEKSPFYCSRMHELARQYPGSSFILIWRDPIEVYRSVLLAGRKTEFFRRRGMLSRLIFYQEKMIQDAAALGKSGFRVHHVHYADLIDNTADACQKICRFLGIQFDAAMLNLGRADLSAVYGAPQHDFLRRGVIERQQIPAEIVPPTEQQRLARFRARWNRLNGAWFPLKNQKSAEPVWGERTFYNFSGRLFCTWDSFKRLLFEFLPLNLLKAHREAKAQKIFGRNESEHSDVPLKQQMRKNWGSVLGGIFAIALVGWADFRNGPQVTLAPFYMLIAVYWTLVLGRRWGTFSAIVATLIWSWLQSLSAPDYFHAKTVIWNSCMRFVVLETVVLLLDQRRRGISSAPNPPV